MRFLLRPSVNLISWLTSLTPAETRGGGCCSHTTVSVLPGRSRGFHGGYRGALLVAPAPSVRTTPRSPDSLHLPPRTPSGYREAL